VFGLFLIFANEEFVLARLSRDHNRRDIDDLGKSAFTMPKNIF